MVKHKNGLKTSRVSSTTKAEIMAKHLFDGLSEKELKNQYGVSPTKIGEWRNQVRSGLESFFSPESDTIRALCKELTSLKKELGEL